MVEISILATVVVAVLVTAVWQAITWNGEDPNHLKLSDDWEPKGGRLYKGWLR